TAWATAILGLTRKFSGPERKKSRAHSFPSGGPRYHLDMASSIPEAAREEHERAGGFISERRFVAAIVHAEAATRLCPDWAAPWWNLCVGYKHARDWEKALAACDRAIALDPDDAEGPHWNAGIAATALGKWARARRAWRAVGIDVPDGDGPLEME